MSYRLLGLLLSIALFVFLILKRFDRKWKKRLLLTFSFLFFLFMTFWYLVPLTPAPKPGGEKEVLTDIVFYKHESSFPDMLTGEGEREIPVRLWYPKDAKEHSQPLFVFSHGSFGVGTSNETLFLELASRGYVVMSLEHPYHSFMTTLSDGRRVTVDFGFMKSVLSSQGSKDLEGTLESLRNWLEIRREDLHFVLDQVLDAEADNEYERYIDTDRIILSGHSLGGSAALAVGRERAEQVKALVVLESPFAMDIEGIEGEEYIFTDEPFPLAILHIYSDSLYPKIGEITTYAMNDRLIKSTDPKFVNKHIEGVGHIGLTDMSLVSPIITNWIDGGLNKRKAPETLFELNRYVREFLEVYGR